MQTQTLMQKARRAAEAAALLIRNEDFEGAVDRAYYAMFHAARAFLFYVDGAEVVPAKTHRSVITRFAQRLADTDDRALGRLLNRAEVLRLKADYSDAVFADRPTAEQVTTDAVTFIARITALLQPNQS